MFVVAAGTNNAEGAEHERYYLYCRSHRRGWRNSLVPGIALIGRRRLARSGIVVQAQETRRRVPAMGFPPSAKSPGLAGAFVASHRAAVSTYLATTGPPGQSNL